MLSAGINTSLQTASKTTLHLFLLPPHEKKKKKLVKTLLGVLFSFIISNNCGFNISLILIAFTKIIMHTFRSLFCYGRCARICAICSGDVFSQSTPLLWDVFQFLPVYLPLLHPNQSSDMSSLNFSMHGLYSPWLRRRRIWLARVGELLSYPLSSGGSLQLFSCCSSNRPCYL